jgi:hypothetical protein
LRLKSQLRGPDTAHAASVANAATEHNGHEQ